jgi:hypothetical protein
MQRSKCSMRVADYNVAIAGQVACAPLDSPLGVFDILLG